MDSTGLLQMTFRLLLNVPISECLLLEITIKCSHGHRKLLKQRLSYSWIMLSHHGYVNEFCYLHSNSEGHDIEVIDDRVIFIYAAILPSINSSWPGVAYMRHEKQLPFP